MGSVIFPVDDMSKYRIIAASSISEEEQESDSKKRDKRKKKKKDLSDSDKKTYDVIAKNAILQTFGVEIEEKELFQNNSSLAEVFAYALLKKEFILSALHTLGISSAKKYKQDWSNRLFRLMLSIPSKKDLLCGTYKQQLSKKKMKHLSSSQDFPLPKPFS